MMFIHWQKQKYIDYYLAGGLSPRQARSFEKHLKTCEECRKALVKEQEFQKHVTEAGSIFEEAWERTFEKIKDLPAVRKPEIYVDSKTIRVRRLSWPALNWDVAGQLIVLAFLVVVGYGVFHKMTIPYITPMSVDEILGQALHRKSATSSEWENVGVLAALQPGDHIRTQEYSRASIQLGKVGQIWLNDGSEVTLYGDASIALEIIAGEMYASVHDLHNTFRVKTPDGIVEVAGTQFHISIDSAKKATLVACAVDTVFFQNSFGKVMVLAGYEAIGKNVLAPEMPVPVDIEKLVKWKNQFDRLGHLSKKARKALREDYTAQGDNFFNHHLYKDALERYLIAVYLDPDDYSPYYGVGRAYRAMGEYALSTGTYLQAISRKPDLTAIKYQYCLTLMEMKQYEEAESILMQLSAKHPSSHTELVYLGDVYLMQNENERARIAYLNAIRLGADNCPECYPRVHGGLAEIYREKKLYNQAGNELTKALQSKDLPSLVYAEAAWLYRDREDLDLEKTAWENYLKLEPKGPYAQEASSRLALMKETQ